MASITSARGKAVEEVILADWDIGRENTDWRYYWDKTRQT